MKPREQHVGIFADSSCAVWSSRLPTISLSSRSHSEKNAKNRVNQKATKSQALQQVEYAKLTSSTQISRPRSASKLSKDSTARRTRLLSSPHGGFPNVGFALTCLGVSVTKIALVSALELILPPGPWRMQSGVIQSSAPRASSGEGGGQRVRKISKFKVWWKVGTTARV